MKSYLTDKEIRDAADELGCDGPILVRNVSQTQLSIARHYGGIKFNGQHYVYIPPTDELIRADALEYIEKERKRAEKERKAAKRKEAECQQLIM